MTRIAFAFDRQTARSFDADGRMRVKDCVLSTAEINPYYGNEIVNHEKLGLDPEGVYELYRDPKELGHADTIASFQGVPLMIKHIAQTAEEPRKEYQAGSVHSVYFDGKRLRGDLLVSDGKAIELIEADKLSDLSCSYRYEPVKYKGEVDGKHYDIRMTEIRGNHVALVDDGRASGAHVADSAFRNPNMPDPSLQGANTMPDIQNGRQPGAAPLPGANDTPAPGAGAAPAPAGGGDAMAQIGAALKMIAEQMTSQHQAILSAIQGKGAAPQAAGAPDMQQAQGANDTDAAETDYERAGREQASGERNNMPGANDSEHETDCAMDNNEEGGAEMEQHAEDEGLELEAAVPGSSEGAGSNPSPRQEGEPSGVYRGGQQGTTARGETTPHQAMDARTVKAVNVAVEAALKRERARVSAIGEAQRAVRGVLGEVYAADSAGAIYREALKVVGVDIKSIAKGAEKAAWHGYQAARQAAAGARPNPELAMDASSIDANQKSLLQHLSKISVRG
jgi:uncharacterized protein